MSYIVQDDGLIRVEGDFQGKCKEGDTEWVSDTIAGIPYLWPVKIIKVAADHVLLERISPFLKAEDQPFVVQAIK